MNSVSSGKRKAHYFQPDRLTGTLCTSVLTFDAPVLRSDEVRVMTTILPKAAGIALSDES